MATTAVDCIAASYDTAIVVMTKRHEDFGVTAAAKGDELVAAT